MRFQSKDIFIGIIGVLVVLGIIFLQANGIVVPEVLGSIAIAVLSYFTGLVSGNGYNEE